MVNKMSEVKSYDLNGKKYIKDDYINVFFVMELVQCKQNKGYKILKESRELAKKDGINIPAGYSTLYYTYKILGLRGNFE